MDITTSLQIRKFTWDCNFIRFPFIPAFIFILISQSCFGPPVHCSALSQMVLTSTTNSVPFSRPYTTLHCLCFIAPWYLLLVPLYRCLTKGNISPLVWSNQWRKVHKSCWTAAVPSLLVNRSSGAQVKSSIDFQPRHSCHHGREYRCRNLYPNIPN